MPGLQPLTVVNGQVEQVENRKCQIRKLNLGPRGNINVNGANATIDVTNEPSWVRVRGTSGVRTTINTINGGEDGDILIIHGRNIRLQGGGNLRLQSAFNMDGSDTICFIYSPNNNWFEISRKPI